MNHIRRKYRIFVMLIVLFIGGSITGLYLFNMKEIFILNEQHAKNNIIEVKKTYPNIILVAISGGGRIDSESYLNTAKYLGADATLKKPFTHAQLLDTLKHFMEEH